MLLQGNTQPKMVVLGLDGLSLALAQLLCTRRSLPGLQHLLDQGASAMFSELPELSPVNWTSFYTASGPETHGIFGFTQLHPGNYQLQVANFSQVACPAIFDRLGQKGLQNRVINLPNTYPARAIPGMLISGFVATELHKAVYPDFLLPRLRQENYKLDADTSKGGQDPDFLLAELRACLSSRHKALNMLWPDLSWNLFVLVLTELDRLGHFLYPALEEPDHPWHSLCMEFIQEWDGQICDVLTRYQELGDPKRLLVLADHGFQRLKTEINLNSWLLNQGFLKYINTPQNEWDSTVISPESKAFALDPGRIYLHTADRYARGKVSERDRQSLKLELKSGLQSLNFQGQQVMAEILDGDQLYPHCTHGHKPDLVCFPQPGFDLKAKFDHRAMFGFFGRYGTHDARDAFFLDSHGESAQRVRQAGEKVLDFFCPAQSKRNIHAH